MDIPDLLAGMLQVLLDKFLVRSPAAPHRILRPASKNILDLSDLLEVYLPPQLAGFLRCGPIVSIG